MTENAVSMRRPRKIRTTQMQTAQNEVSAKWADCLKPQAVQKLQLLKVPPAAQNTQHILWRVLNALWPAAADSFLSITFLAALVT